jgi:hypothetical protein
MGLVEDTVTDGVKKITLDELEEEVEIEVVLRLDNLLEFDDVRVV